VCLASSGGHFFLGGLALLVGVSMLLVFGVGL
jgi:hypothetical protein